MVRTKICGITSVEDARAAMASGADAIGLMFYARSSRHVDIDTAAAVARAVGPFVTTVGLFVDADAGFVRDVLDRVPLQVLQFHGNETADYCETFDRPYVKALRMRPDVDVLYEIAQFPGASAILLDAYRPGVPGGTGEVFDWARIPNDAPLPLILAGGLNPENVGEAAQIPGLYAVDVSGGVESSPGKKDHQKVERFITNARCGLNSGDTNRE